jgi:hypothetical protein
MTIMTKLSCLMYRMFAESKMVKVVSVVAMLLLAATSVEAQCGQNVFTVSTRLRFPARGGDSSITVRPSLGCGYYIVSVSDFITVTPSPAGGVGDATVPFHVAPNSSGAERKGMVSVSLANDWLVQVTQLPDNVLIPDTDFDGDGYADLVWRNRTTGAIAIWFMNRRTISPQSGLTSLQFTDNSFVLAGSGDFNRDGKADLLWHNNATGQTILWAMDGKDVVSGSGELPRVSAPWQIVGVGDFNGDGYPDLLWRNLVDGQDSIWLLKGTEVQLGSAALPQISDMNWKIAAVADFDGDGKSDVLWHNEVTGLTVVWRMDGSSLIGSSPLSRQLPPAFHVAAVSGRILQPRPSFVGPASHVIVYWRSETTGDTARWGLDGSTVVFVSSSESPVTDPNFQLEAMGDFDGLDRENFVWRNVVTGDAWMWTGDSRMQASSFATIPADWSIVAPQPLAWK